VTQIAAVRSLESVSPTRPFAGPLGRRIFALDVDEVEPATAVIVFVDRLTYEPGTYCHDFRAQGHQEVDEPDARED